MWEGTDKNDAHTSTNEIGGERRNKLEDPNSQKKMYREESDGQGRAIRRPVQAEKKEKSQKEKQKKKKNSRPASVWAISRDWWEQSLVSQWQDMLGAIAKSQEAEVSAGFTNTGSSHTEQGRCKDRGTILSFSYLLPAKT